MASSNNSNIPGVALGSGAVNMLCGPGAASGVGVATGSGVTGGGGSSHSSSWGCQMDSMVSDLSHALDESQTLQRKRRPFRRRVNPSKGATVLLLNLSQKMLL